MKKIISLQVLMLMGLAIGSASTIDAYSNSSKASSKNAQSCANKEVKTMNEFKDALGKIEKDFKEFGNPDFENSASATQKLDALEKELPCVIKKLQVEGGTFNVSKRHAKVLRKKLAEVRILVTSKLA